MLEDMAGYYVQRKRARTLHIISQLLDDLPSLDAPSQANTGISLSLLSSSSPSFVSSPSFDILDISGSTSLGTRSRHGSSSSEDFDHLKAQLLEQWDAQIQALMIYLLTARVLKACPPVKKSGQLDLYLTDF